MDELSNINWVISTIGAVVLSILANLLTGPVQDWLAKRSDRRSENRAKELRAQFEEVADLVHSPTKFYLTILVLVVKVLLADLVASLLSNILYAVVFQFRAGSILVPFTTALVYVVGINYAYKALRLIGRVRNFSKYENEIASRIASLKGPPAIEAASPQE